MGMELALSEMPLALFSTLAPMGAGAFTLLAVAFFTRTFDAEVLKKVDRLTVIPLIFVVVGFICAFFHLASPQNAFGVFANIGSSPMSNEILVGVIFCVVAVVYWIVAMMANLSEGTRKGFCAVVAVIGLIFCAFIGLAYGMDTIPSWNIPVVPISTLFFGLLGGVAVGMATLYAAGASETDAPFAKAATVLTGASVIGSALFFGIQMGMVSGMQNAMVTGSELVGSVLPLVICGIILMFVAAAIMFIEIRKKVSAVMPWLAVIIVFAGILLVRLSFYGVEMSIGLGI